MPIVAGTGLCLVAPRHVYGLAFAVAVCYMTAHQTAYAQPSQTGDLPDRADRTTSATNLRRLAIAMHLYEDTYGFLPPSSIDSKDGKPLLSWRVALLPFLGEEQLYKQFRLNEAWDSAHNKRLLAKWPAAFLCPGPELKEKYTTYYQVFIGAPGPFRPDQKTDRTQIGDAKGCSRTLLIVEGGEPVPWTKPVDLAYATDKALPRLGGRFPDGFHACFCDGSVCFIKRGIPKSLLRHVISMEDDGWDKGVMAYLRPTK
jgi:hypothetical protein